MLLLLSKIQRIWINAALLALIATSVGCDTPTEGCTDPTAKNFNAEADKDCCCTYYQLKFALQHSLNDTTNLALLTTYPNPVGADSFQLQSVKILIYDIFLINLAGERFAVEDSLLLSFSDGSSAYMQNDFIAVTPSSFVLQAGTFTRLGSYDSIAFSVGLAPDAQLITPNSLPDNHNLSGFYDIDARQYLAQSFGIILPNIQDTFAIKITEPTQLTLPAIIQVEEGADTPIPLTVLYSKFWENVDWYNDDSLSIVQKIKNNTSNAFFIRP